MRSSALGIDCSDKRLDDGGFEKILRYHVSSNGASVCNRIQCRENLLRSLPFELLRKDFSTLKTLNLRGNRLGPLIDDIFKQLSNLQWLSLSKNNVTNIPKSICLMKQLKELYIYENNIRMIPREMCMLEQLDVLWIDRNKISKIPSEIVQLKEMGTFKFSENPLPLEIMQTCPDVFTRPKVAEVCLKMHEYFLNEERAISAALLLVWARKCHKDECGVLGSLPREIVKIIAMRVIDTKKEMCWRY